MTSLYQECQLLTHCHGDDEEDRADVGGIGKNLERGEISEDDEDGKQNGVDFPRAEAYGIVRSAHSSTVGYPLRRG